MNSLLSLVLLAPLPDLPPIPPGVPVIELGAPLRKFPAPEAQQGVAVDSEFLYIIGNRVVGKYSRATGAIVASFEGKEEDGWIHMNGGTVHNGKLYCSHSNFSGVPMESSLEVFDTKTLTHLSSQSFGMGIGSFLWLERRGSDWWTCFGHYNGKGGEPGMPNTKSALHLVDSSFRPLRSYSFPPEVIARWDGMTCSGGVWGRDGLLYATGHHAPEIHVLALPKVGSRLLLKAIIKTPVEGQGLALDRKSNRLFQMRRSDRSVYEFEMPDLSKSGVKGT